jgi:inosine-uridine nucleoside N-ribohydrolase
VPVVVMPLDSTEIPLSEPQRSALFAHGSGLSDALTLLYHQWRFLNSWHMDTPVLFDVVPVAYVIDPTLCPTVKLRLTVDDKGFTRVQPGAANADVCLSGAQDKIAQTMVQALLQH